VRHAQELDPFHVADDCDARRRHGGSGARP
jgi:hypothetical protein